jgi:magnesium-transporting ATPase (P-type)
MSVDPKKYNKQTRFRLILWFVILLFTLGLGMIWLIYGKNAALLGLLCLLGMAIPVGLIALVMLGLDKIVKKDQ